MPFEYFTRLFPQKHAPFTLREITTCLQHVYAHENIEITEERVRNAKHALAEMPALAELMVPLEGNNREHMYCAAAAARIARRVVGGHIPNSESEMLRKDKAIAELCTMLARNQYTIELYRRAFIALGINPDEITATTFTRITRPIVLPSLAERAVEENLQLKPASNPTQIRLNPKTRLRPVRRRA